MLAAIVKVCKTPNTSSFYINTTAVETGLCRGQTNLAMLDNACPKSLFPVQVFIDKKDGGKNIVDVDIIIIVTVIKSNKGQHYCL